MIIEPFAADVYVATEGPEREVAYLRHLLIPYLVELEITGNNFGALPSHVRAIEGTEAQTLRAPLVALWRVWRCHQMIEAHEARHNLIYRYVVRARLDGLMFGGARFDIPTPARAGCIVYTAWGSFIDVYAVCNRAGWDGYADTLLDTAVACFGNRTRHRGCPASFSGELLVSWGLLDMGLVVSPLCPPQAMHGLVRRSCCEQYTLWGTCFRAARASMERHRRLVTAKRSQNFLSHAGHCGVKCNPMQGDDAKHNVRLSIPLWQQPIMDVVKRDETFCRNGREATLNYTNRLCMDPPRPHLAMLT